MRVLVGVRKPQGKSDLHNPSNKHKFLSGFYNYHKIALFDHIFVPKFWRT